MILYMPYCRHGWMDECMNDYVLTQSPQYFSHMLYGENMFKPGHFDRFTKTVKKKLKDRHDLYQKHEPIDLSIHVIRFIK